MAEFQSSGVAPRPDNRVVPTTAWSQTPPALSGGKVYAVQARDGESFWEIAQRTLGNGHRWSEILRLNPGIDPARRIPPGTLLQVPPDARVEP